MRCKIRYLTRQRTGRVAQDEQIVKVEGNRISLGRGTDSTVFLRDLRVNYHHADLVVHDDEIVIEAVGHSILRVDRRPGRARGSSRRTPRSRSGPIACSSARTSRTPI